jgi:pyrophosphatase PpaX
VGYPVCLFDLDGTIVDSAWMILQSFHHATRTVAGREFPDDVLKAQVGSGHLAQQMRDLMEDADDELIDRLVETYRAHYAPLHSELEAFPGMIELLEELDEDGRRIGIVTAKIRQVVELAFDALPFGHTVDIVVGSDAAPRGKPHPDQILVALELLGARPEDAVYVGDAPFDVAAAKAAGVHAVGVTWGGFHARERMEAEGPDVVVDNPEELRAVLL